jgi:chloramphenicol O-acetyltransferase type A
MYQSIKAVNRVENFRYRIIDGQVYLFDVVHPSTTVARKDNSFGFALFEYSDSFGTFSINAKKKIAEVQTYSGLRIEENAQRVDVVHCTTVPWFSFTGVKHDRASDVERASPNLLMANISSRLAESCCLFL